MLNREYWKASSSYSNGLLLPTAKNVYQNSAIIAGQPIDKSIATSWFKTKFSTLSRNDRAQTSKHEVKEYNVFSVFSTLSGNATVAYNYKGSALKYSGSGWDVTRFICGIDTSVINVFVPVILYSSTKQTVTVSAINFINNFKDYKDYDYAILGRPVKNDGYGSTEFSLHFIIENEEYGAILQFSGIDNFTSVSSHQWIGGNICQANFTGSNTSTARYAESNELMVKSDTYPRVWIMPYASEELKDGEDINAYNKFLLSFEKYVVVEQYNGVERACWSPDVIYELIRHIGIPLRDTSAVTSETKVYIPMVDENGYHSGNWVLSTDKAAKDSSLYKAQTDKNTIDPTKPPTPSGDNDNIEPIDFGFKPTIGGVGELYELTGSEWSSFKGWLKTDHEKDIASSIYFARQVPFSAVSKFDLATNPSKVEILLNGEHSGVNATLITGQNGSNVQHDFTIPRVHNNFLDYSPYSVYELLFPFTSASMVLPDWCLDKTISCIMLFDVMTGTCKWLVCADGESVGSVSGKYCIDMPLSFENTFTKENAQINSALSLASNTAGLVSNGLLGNLAGMGNSALGLLSTAIQSSRVDNANYYTSVGSSSDASDLFTSNHIHLRITHVNSMEDDTYSHCNGRPLLKTAELSSLTGYTECVNVDVSGINCTNEEKEMIKTLLETGVYL